MEPVWIPLVVDEPLAGEKIRFILKTGFASRGTVLAVGLDHVVQAPEGNFPLHLIVFWLPVEETADEPH